jgi:hypothetical protein
MEKEKKDIKFPEPPLEVGVAKYPTPVVPNYNDHKGGWNLTDQGHIILVEKISIDKGNFTPLPLDGSVTYSGRDAKRWPSSLYLVAEIPTSDGRFCNRVWANDRSLASQDPWNYGIKYESGDPNYPSYIREYIVPRKQYSAVNVGTQDPIFGSGQQVSLSINAGIVAVSGSNFNYSIGSTISVYTNTAQTDPNAIIGSFTLLASPAPTSTNLYFTAPVGGTIPTGNIYINPTVISEQQMEALPEDNPLRSRYVKVTRLYEPIPGTVLVTNENKPGLMGTIQRNDQLVNATTKPNDLSLDTADGSVIQSQVEHVSAVKSNMTTVITTGPYELDGKALQEFGFATTKEQIVSYGTAPTADKNTIKVEVNPIDLTKSKQTSLLYTSPSTITSRQYDENLNVNITTTKSIVLPSTVITGGNGVISERVDAVNPYQSIHITSKLDSLPAPRIEYKTSSYSSPALLYSFTAGTYASTNGNVYSFVAPTMDARRNYQTTFKQSRYYTYGAPSVSNWGYSGVVFPTESNIINPITQPVYYDGIWISVNVGDCLSDGPAVHLTVPSGTPSGGPWVNTVTENYTAPTTNITASQWKTYRDTHQYIMIGFDIEYWKANIYVTTIISVLVL